MSQGYGYNNNEYYSGTGTSEGYTSSSYSTYYDQNGNQSYYESNYDQSTAPYNTHSKSTDPQSPVPDLVSISFLKVLHNWSNYKNRLLKRKKIANAANGHGDIAMDVRLVAAVLTKLEKRATIRGLAILASQVATTATVASHAVCVNGNEKVAKGPAVRVEDKEGSIAMKDHLVLLATQRFSAET